MNGWHHKLWTPYSNFILIAIVYKYWIIIHIYHFWSHAFLNFEWRAVQTKVAMFSFRVTRLKALAVGVVPGFSCGTTDRDKLGWENTWIRVVVLVITITIIITFMFTRIFMFILKFIITIIIFIIDIFMFIFIFTLLHPHHHHSPTPESLTNAKSHSTRVSWDPRSLHWWTSLNQPVTSLLGRAGWHVFSNLCWLLPVAYRVKFGWASCLLIRVLKMDVLSYMFYSKIVHIIIDLHIST